MIYELLRPPGGSISAEHGIGLEKLAYLDVSRTGAEIDPMRRLKSMMDLKDTLNPGKVFSLGLTPSFGTSETGCGRSVAPSKAEAFKGRKLCER